MIAPHLGGATWLLAVLLVAGATRVAAGPSDSAFAAGGGGGLGFGTGDWADSAKWGITLTAYGEGSLDDFFDGLWIRGAVGHLALEGDDIDTQEWFFTASAVLRLGRPYALAGIGLYDGKFEVTLKDDGGIGGPPPLREEVEVKERDWGVHAGAGLEFDVAPDWAIRTEALVHHIRHPDLTSLTDTLIFVTAGAVYFF